MAAAEEVYEKVKTTDIKVSYLFLYMYYNLYFVYLHTKLNYLDLRQTLTIKGLHDFDTSFQEFDSSNINIYLFSRKA